MLSERALTMSLEFKRIPGEPIVISTLIPPLDIANDAADTFSQLVYYLDEIDGHVYYISDTTQLDEVGFSEIVMGLSAVTRDPTSPLGNPRLKTYVVSNQDMITLGVSSLHQEQYGQLPVELVGSIEEALTQIRAEMAGSR